MSGRTANTIWSKMKIDPGYTKLKKSRVSMDSRFPPLATLTIETSDGIEHFAIDEESATVLLDEVLSFFGVVRPEIQP